ncbi:MAG: hypothetical protein SNJ59_01355 [Aggregatilineales bacterium]
MGRVINPDSTGKQRNQLMRTIAELVRRLGQKTVVDDDAKDMAALLIYCLREIDQGIDTSAAAWEKRDYWMKADELRQRWAWAGEIADRLYSLILDERWDEFPAILVQLMPHISDIKITKFTRDESLWQNAHARLLLERAPNEH